MAGNLNLKEFIGIFPMHLKTRHRVTVAKSVSRLYKHPVHMVIINRKHEGVRPRKKFTLKWYGKFLSEPTHYAPSPCLLNPSEAIFTIPRVKIWKNYLLFLYPVQACLLFNTERYKSCTLARNKTYTIVIQTENSAVNRYTEIMPNKSKYTHMEISSKVYIAF